jgi:hypothetical protein
MYCEINRCLKWCNGVQRPANLESQHVQAVSDTDRSWTFAYRKTVTPRGICSGTEGRRLWNWVHNTSDRRINFISARSTLLLSRVYRACAVECGLSKWRLHQVMQPNSALCWTQRIYMVYKIQIQNRTHVYMNFFDHKDLGNHLLQLCPKVVIHPVYWTYSYGCETWSLELNKYA